MPNFLILLVISLVSLVAGQTSNESAPKADSVSDARVVDPFLAPGLDEIRKAVALREKFLKDGFDFNKAEHVPELEQQMPVLTAYYESAIQNTPKKRKVVDKILKDMRIAFDKKNMSMTAWTNFHNRLNRAFLPQGSTTRFDLSPPSGNVLRWFIYERDGLLGLQALNLAFVSDIEALPAATAETIRADGIDYNPVFLAAHDEGHFDSFKRSAYSFKRFKDKLKAVYDRIEAQADPLERARDHLVFFMFIHESLASSYNYHHTLGDAFRDSYNDMVQTLKFRFGRSKDGIKTAIYKDLAFDVLKPGMVIEKTGVGQYSIKGSSNTDKPTVLQAKVEKENNRLLIHVSEGSKKIRTIDTSMIQFADFDPILKTLCTDATYSELSIAPTMDGFARRFLNKYAGAGNV